MTPSQARTLSASSIARSIRDGGSDRSGCTARDHGELDRRHARLGLGRGDALPQRAQLTAQDAEPGTEHCLGLGVERLGVEPRTDPRDLAQHACLAMRQLVEVLLEIVDRDLLRDDAPEPGEAGNRVLHPVDRDADGERRAALLARRHR